MAYQEDPLTGAAHQEVRLDRREEHQEVADLQGTSMDNQGHRQVAVALRVDRQVVDLRMDFQTTEAIRIIFVKFASSQTSAF